MCIDLLPELCGVKHPLDAREHILLPFLPCEDGLSISEHMLEEEVVRQRVPPGLEFLHESIGLLLGEFGDKGLIVIH